MNFVEAQPTTPTSIVSNTKSPYEAQLFTALFVSIFALWPTGIDQIFPPIILFLFFVLYKKPYGFNFATPNRKDFFFISLILFLSLAALSGFGIQDGVRIITFSRDIMLWGSAIFFFMFVRKKFFGADLLNSARAMNLAFFIIMISCLIYIIIGSIEFPSIAYLVLPDFIQTSMMGKRVLLKDFGEQLYFYGFTDRVKSFFGSPIHLSCIIFLLLPFAMHSDSRNPTFRFLRSLFCFAIAAFILFFAQARVAIILIVLFPLTEMTMKAIFRAKKHGFSWVLALAAVGTLVVLAPFFIDSLDSFLYDLLFERRAGSAGARSQIYQQSLLWVQNSPFFGYGTQIDIPDLDYPLGSHSTPLGLAFKYGIPAASIMMIFLLGCFFRSAKALSNARDRMHETFYARLSASLMSYYFLLLINEFIVDVYHTLFLFALLGALVGSTDKPHLVQAAKRTSA